MDTLTIVILVVVAGLVVAGGVLLMLNRAWGDFPPRASRLSEAPPPPPRATGPTFETGTPPESGLVPVSNPMIRRAAEAALERGGPMARAVVRQGDQIYFSLDHIADPGLRREAYDILWRIENDQDVDLRRAMQVIRQIFPS